MSAIVIDIECFSNNIIKELGIYKEGITTGLSFLPSSNLKSTPQDAYLTKNLHYMSWNSGTYSYEILDDIVQEYKNLEKVEFFAKGEEKCKFLSNLFNGVQFTNLEDYGCPKVTELSFVDEEDHKFCDGFICSSYPFRHQYTHHCAERKAYMYGQWTVTHFVNCL